MAKSLKTEHNGQQWRWDPFLREKGQNDTVDDDDIKDEEYIYSLDGSEDETLLEEQGHDVSVDNNNIVLFIYLFFFYGLSVLYGSF